MTPKYQRKILRPIRVEGDAAYVTLTGGHEAIIDAADVPLVAGVHWQAWPNHAGNIYAARKVVCDGKQRTRRMHHLILPLADGLMVDHIDGNGLNNRRSNLRLVSASDNNRNSRRRRSGQGVRFDARRGNYAAILHLGMYATEAEAAAAVEEARAALQLRQAA